jgi:hypothetical protein
MKNLTLKVKKLSSKLPKYRVLLQDVASELKFAIFVNATGLFDATSQAVEEFPWAQVILIEKL